jgi:Leucine-rich repeat (LRR) protein
MTKTNLFALLSIQAISFAAISRTQDNGADAPNEPNNPAGNNNLGLGQIEMKGYPDDARCGDADKNKMSFWAAAKKITVDWGDGTVKEITLNGFEREFIHTYANQNFQTITLNTEGLSMLRMTPYGHGGTKGAIHELRIGNVPKLEFIVCRQALTVLEINKAEALKSLNCGNNQLTSLNVNNNTALHDLDCRSNQLTASALNDLFRSLPVFSPYYRYYYSGEPQAGGYYVEYGYISIGNNPGASTCDKSIAEAKKWQVIVGGTQH